MSVRRIAYDPVLYHHTHTPLGESQRGVRCVTAYERELEGP
jgi:hypothetical protein